MKRDLSRLPGPWRAFTLIELLLAISIMAMLLVALFTFVFSMGEIWGHGSEKRLFEQHVNAVTRHMEAMFRRATLPIGSGSPTEPFTVREVRTPTSGTADLLGFDLSNGDRLFVWNGPPLPEVQCSLGVDSNRGLMLYWQSKLEIHRDTEPPRVVVVSPFVTKLEYFYRDDDTGSWRGDTSLKKSTEGHWLVPDCIKLTFAHAGVTTERMMTLPARNGALPLF
jgi:prepilin-type N-terminal cleavage/methylation domain-containing protein